MIVAIATGKNIKNKLYLDIIIMIDKTTVHKIAKVIMLFFTYFLFSIISSRLESDKDFFFMIRDLKFYTKKANCFQLHFTL